MEPFAIFVYLVMVAISSALTTAKETGHAIVTYRAIMTQGPYAWTPSWMINTFSNFVPFVGFISSLFVFTEGGFVWPRKGVNYLKPSDRRW